jgi:hypothetical protein
MVSQLLDPGYNPAAEAFKNFDQDQQNGLLGSLHLDNDDEPRRGASRANSVRFDESALHGHFAQVSRSSSDFFPLRTGSGLGSHPMVERSSSHKSDGRQSSAGLSNHSARTNSLGLESSKFLGRVGNTTDMPLGPAPGLFILGPVPSIIRCWLDTNFSNETLLYAVVCTGSYKSLLSQNSVSRLGLEHQLTKDENGAHHVRIPVYLPEATIQQATSSMPSSPAPQLPVLTINFTVQDCESEGRAIQIFLGSDVLRAHNADILLSQDRLTLYDDARNKLSIPLVRPEDVSVYKDLVTFAQAPDTSRLLRKGTTEQQPRVEVDAAVKSTSNKSVEANGASSNASVLDHSNNGNPGNNAAASGDYSKPAISQDPEQDSMAMGKDDKPSPPNGLENVSVNGTPTRPESGSIWGSWRRDSMPHARVETVHSSNSTTGSGYQRAGRGSRGMKVLKPTKLGTTASSRSFSATTPTLTGFDAAPPRFNDSGRQSSQTARSDEKDDQSSESRRSVSSEAKNPPPGSKEPHVVASRSRSANPIGGASAFGWLNPSQQKRAAAAGE